MIRKSTARRGSAPSENAEAAEDHDTFDDAPRPRAGAGGRWWVWAGRAVLWAFLIVVIVNGVWLPFRDGFAQQPEKKDTSSEDPEFPTTAATAFASRFADAYLNAGDNAGGSDASATERAEAIAEFVPDGEADSFDLADSSLTAKNVEVIAVNPEDKHNGVVTLSADIDGKPMSLDVPVYADDPTSLVVSGQPALLPAPSKAELPDDTSTATDDEASEQLRDYLKGFFEAYAETPDHLSQYTDEGADISPLPTGTLKLSDVSDVTVPPESGNGDDVRTATATVVWQRTGDSDSGGSGELTQSYAVTVVKDGSDWRVRDIEGAPQSFGQ